MTAMTMGMKELCARYSAKAASGGDNSFSFRSSSQPYESGDHDMLMMSRAKDKSESISAGRQ